MLLPTRLSFAIAAAAALATVASATYDPSVLNINGWYPCSYSSPNGAVNTTSFDSMTIFDCAEMEVPLCYEGVCESDKMVSVFVKRLLAETPPPEGTPRKALIALQGGPGASSEAMENTMTTMLGLLGNTVDYYTIDHRGTGRSEFLECDAAQALTSGSPGGAGLSLDELESCMKDLTHKYDGQAAGFSTTTVAMDVRTMIEGFLSEHQVYVYGYSYGTYLTQRILQLEIPQVVGYIFDGVDVLSVKDDPLESANSHWNKALQGPSRRLLQFCFDDPTCPLKLKSRDTAMEELTAFLAEFDAAVETNECAKTIVQGAAYDIPSVALRFHAYELVQDMSTRPNILDMYARAQRCNEEDVAVFGEMFPPLDLETRRRLFTKGTSPDPIADSSSLLYNLVVFSERWSQPPPTMAERERFVLDGVMAIDDNSLHQMYCVFTGSTSPACEELRETLPKTNATFYYPRDEYTETPLVVPAHASALIFNGGMDTATPQEFGELLYHKLSGSGKGVMMVNFDFGVHCNGEAVLDSPDTPCRDFIAAAFIAGDGDVNAIDTKCMEELPVASFGTAEAARK